MLLVDGGDFIHRNGKDNYLESVLSWTEMVERGYDAVTLGELELEQWDLTDSLLTHTTLPVVCTNVECLRGDRWEPVGERYRIVEVNGIRVGIVSAIGPNQMGDRVVQKSGGRLRMLPPAETAQATIDEIKDQTDAVVLLAHLDPRPMEQYASTLTDVDVILGGHMTQLDTGPMLSSNAIINRSSTRGQHLAITRLIVSPEGTVVDFGGLNITLDPSYPENPDVADAAAFAKEEDQRLVRERNERRRDAIQQRTEPGGTEEGKGGGVERPGNR